MHIYIYLGYMMIVHVFQRLGSLLPEHCFQKHASMYTYKFLQCGVTYIDVCYVLLMELNFLSEYAW